MARHTVNADPVPELLCFMPDWREKINATLEPYLLPQKKLHDAVRATERAVGSLLAAGIQRLNRKPEPVAKSVRGELEQLRSLGESMSSRPFRLSDDAEWFLIGAGTVDDRELAEIASAGGLLRIAAERGLAALDDEKPPVPRPGPAYRWGYRTCGECLLDVWIEYTERGTSRHNRPLDSETTRDDGPFPTYMRTVIQAIDPEFRGVKLAREIHEMRRARKRADEGRA